MHGHTKYFLKMSLCAVSVTVKTWLSLVALQKPGAGPRLSKETWPFNREKPGTGQLKLHHKSCFTAPLILLMCTLKTCFIKKKKNCALLLTHLMLSFLTGQGMEFTCQHCFQRDLYFFFFSGNGRKQNISYPWCVAIHQAESSGIS